MAPRTRTPHRRAPNLLILGASGNVARALLRRLGGRRDHFGRLLLLDRSDRVRSDRFLEHRRLDYRFIHRRLRWPEDRVSYQELLRRHRIDIAVDLTDMDTLPVLAATDAAGVSYVNTSLNDSRRGVTELVAAFHPVRDRIRHAPHILCSGMNPGAVNAWVCHGVRRYGVPEEIVHFEYDTSTPADRWRPVVTWSRKEFLTETAWEPTGLVMNGEPVIYPATALERREDMAPYLKPLVPLPVYPKGFLVLHEENLTLGRRFGVSSKFLYAIHPKTTDYLVRRLRRRGRLRLSDLEVANNTSIPLDGSDRIGVCLEYPRQRVFYLHTLDNGAALGTNATCAQVAVGVYAALFTLLEGRLAPRIHSAGDLYDTIYPHVVFDNMRVEHFVFARRKRSLALRRHVPALRLRLPRRAEQVVI
jgi:hypothetical protein